ncbi:hypothetical protein Scep_027121 [Stephania cephalantha]|uniref:Transmembrane protein 45B n=1 Tax=Stephania cephalantha TaxID=152367 RepID=A0AAP0HSL5_9MAGN
MGSFKGHVVPGTLFMAIGIWHVWSCLVRFVTDPRSFRVRVWSPVQGFDGKLKYLELYVVAIGAFVDLCIELLYSTHLRFFVDGVLNPSHMNNFEHSAMLFMFFVFGVAALISQKTRYLPLPDRALCLIAAAAFFAPITTVTGAIFPTSFLVDLSCGIAITLQGLWFYQTAFTLYGPMMPDGCQRNDDKISCRSADSEVRGELLANSQLFFMVFGVFTAILVAYSFAASRYGHPELRQIVNS